MGLEWDSLAGEIMMIMIIMIIVVMVMVTVTVVSSGDSETSLQCCLQ